MATKRIPTIAESIASFERLKLAEKRLYDFAGSCTSPDYQQLKEDVHAAHKGLLPRVGLGCTIIYYSDYRAATLTRVISPTCVEVTHNKTKCLDWYAGNYEILPELEEGHTDVFTKRSNGLWCMVGQSTRDGVILALTHQSHYIDPCF